MAGVLARLACQRAVLFVAKASRATQSADPGTIAPTLDIAIRHGDKQCAARCRRPWPVTQGVGEGVRPPTERKAG
jgi:hypothetical protein